MKHLEHFLKMKFESEFPSQYTIKFFQRDNVGFQNSILIDPENQIIVDMKISDKDIFANIIKEYSDTISSDENNTNVKLREKINLFEFLVKIVTPIEDHAVIGFITHYNKSDNSKEERAPGTISYNYVIN